MNITQYNKWLLEDVTLVIIVSIVYFIILVVTYCLKKSKTKKNKVISIVSCLLLVFPLVAACIYCAIIGLDYNNPITYEGTYEIEVYHTGGVSRAIIYLVDTNVQLDLEIGTFDDDFENTTYHGKLIYAKHIKALFYWEGNIIGS